MRIILPNIPDPPDLVIQGAQFVTGSFDGTQAGLYTYIQGDMGKPSDMPEVPVIRSVLPPWAEMWGMPATVGKMVIAGGELVDIKTANPPGWLVEFPTPFQVPTASDIVADDLPDENPLSVMPSLEVRPKEVSLSLLKQVTTSNPTSRVRPQRVWAETTQKFVIAGVTKDGAGTALGNCAVLVFKSTRMVLNPDPAANPIETSVVSDGSGNFSVQVNANESYQLIAYLPGSPDKAGISVNIVKPTVQ